MRRLPSSASRSPGEARASTRRATTERASCIVAVDPRYFRPTEVDTLLGDATQGAHEARLDDRRSDSGELVAEMVREDLKSAERDELVKRHGHRVYDRNE